MRIISTYFSLGVFNIKSERSGKYVNVLYGEMAYKAFVPTVLPPNPPINVNEELALLMGKAQRAIGSF
ncbi:MAG TPA: hypothetical protein VMW91_09625 [Desulfosporosinus sp.]|nr:hypothetical protein [Desulfosporosinus sp.]